MAKQPSSFFATTAIDHAVAGLGAGVVTTLCLNPLDLLKIKFQVNTGAPAAGIGKQIFYALRDVQQQQGWKGLYRGISPNIAGNASSWGLYFLFYNMLKKQAAGGDVNKPLTAAQYLICSAEASAVTAVVTNPFWLVRVRMFASTKDSPGAYRGLWGWTVNHLELGVFDYVNFKQVHGFCCYIPLPGGQIKNPSAYFSSSFPPNLTHTTKNNAQSELFPDIPTTIRRTWKQEGLRGFYRGLGTSLVRVLPGNCITFVVYENLAWLLRTSAARRDARHASEHSSRYGR
ncbi:hypothetical protein NP233_g4585 [Leucocoprinus birnbaumii]|uniref:Uncharacterized protein n=1 Tax=Leucocoprinus birnbaumii TaxID=56174 RepID=A0AAD5YVD1_9AGAR|nr:hypothetical protein NP233_g4585 [Leucocoprinus birnbaumii]